MNVVTELEQTLAEVAADAASVAERTKAVLQRLRASRADVAPVVQLPAEPELPRIDELYAAIERLLKERPMRFSDLRKSTGATDNRIKSVIIRLQRNSPNVVNLGNKHKAMWAWVSDEFLLRLQR